MTDQPIDTSPEAVESLCKQRDECRTWELMNSDVRRAFDEDAAMLRALAAERDRLQKSSDEFAGLWADNSEAAGKAAKRVADLGAELLRVRTTAHGAAHALDAVGQVLGIDVSDRNASRVQREVEYLKAIVDKLPKTADGVPVTLGMVVYCDMSGRPGWSSAGYTVVAGEVGCENGEWCSKMCGCLSESESRPVSWAFERVSECYSTREAAEAAAKGNKCEG